MTKTPKCPDCGGPTTFCQTAEYKGDNEALRRLAATITSQPDVCAKCKGKRQREASDAQTNQRVSAAISAHHLPRNVRKHCFHNRDLEKTAHNEDAWSFGLHFRLMAERPNLYLYGDEGRGKTTLALAIVNDFIDNNDSAAAVPCGTAISWMLAKRYGARELRKLAHYGVLYLDGLDRMTWTRERLDKFAALMSARQGKRTIVTSRATPEIIHGVWTRVASRQKATNTIKLLSPCERVQMVGPNLRPEKKGEQHHGDEQTGNHDSDENTGDSGDAERAGDEYENIARYADYKRGD